jgi:hypothetical protein
VSSPLELLDVLPRAQMGELVARRLEEQGYVREGNQLKKEDGDLEVIVDLDEGTVSVKVSGDKQLDLEEERTGVTWEEKAKSAEGQLRAAAKEALKNQADVEETRLQSEVTEKLEKKLAEVKGEVDDAVNRATGDALKERAKQMGEVTEVHEDEETGSLTIKVKV